MGPKYLSYLLWLVVPNPLYSWAGNYNFLLIVGIHSNFPSCHINYQEDTVDYVVVM